MVCTAPVCFAQVARGRAARARLLAAGVADGSLPATWQPRAVSFASLGRGSAALGLELEYDAEARRCCVCRCVVGGQAHARGVVLDAKVLLVAAPARNGDDSDDEGDDDEEEAAEGEARRGSGVEFGKRGAVAVEVRSLGDFERAVLRLNGRPFEVTFLEPTTHGQNLNGPPLNGHNLNGLLFNGSLGPAGPAASSAAARFRVDELAAARVYAAAAASPGGVSAATAAEQGAAIGAARGSEVDAANGGQGAITKGAGVLGEARAFPGATLGRSAEALSAEAAEAEADGEAWTFATGRGVGDDDEGFGLRAARALPPREGLPWNQPADDAPPAEAHQAPPPAAEAPAAELPRLPLDLPLALSRSEDAIVVPSSSSSSSSSSSRRPKRRGSNLPLSGEPRAVALHFVNDSPHFRLEVSWVDFDGAPVLRRVLEPGEQHLEQSWAGHAWCATAVPPPRFDPQRHADADDAEWSEPERAESNPALVLRVGAAAAGGGGYALTWAPRRRSLSLSSRDAAAARLSSDRPKDRHTAGSSAQRVRAARVGLLQELRALRADPTGRGASPTLTLTLVASRRGESVLRPPP
jgi:hypothetical protein